VSRRGPAWRPQDVTDSRQGRAIERFWTFIDACEPTRAERRHVAEVVVANHDWTYAIVTEAAATGHRGFADLLLRQVENISWVNRCGWSRVDGGSDRDGNATADSSCVASARSH
jgi:hypothetical protein